MFECKRCGYQTPKRYNIKSHLSRLRVCRPKDANSDIPIQVLIDELSTSSTSVSCIYCDKQYSSSSVLNRHQKTCKAANKPILITKKSIDELLARHNTQTTTAIAAPPVLNQNIGTLNAVDNSNHVHITFNNVSDLKDADHRAIAAFFKAISKERMIDYVHMDIPNIHPTMFKELLYNLEHKENITLAITDPTKNEAKFLMDGRWQKTRDANDFVNDLLLVNATKVKEANYSLPKNLQRNSNELNPLFNTSGIIPGIMKLAHDNLHVVEEVHGKIA